MTRPRGFIVVLLLLTACAGSPLTPEGPDWRASIGKSLARHAEAPVMAPGLVEVEFAFTPEISAKTVHLTGSFAGWNPTAIAMADDDGDGTWTVTHALRAGEHLYKFVVDSDRWFHDPDNPNRIDDGHQGFNSVLRVGLEEERAVPRAGWDGHVEEAHLSHDPRGGMMLRRSGPDSIQLMLRTPRGDIESATVLLGVDRQPRRVPMDFLWSDDLHDHHGADLDLSPDEIAGPLGYLFEVRDGEDIVQLGIEGATRDGSPWPAPFVTVPEDLLFDPVPGWARDAVWYQIFPERFRNGDPSNDEDHVLPWTWDWPEPFNAEEEAEFYVWVFFRKFGGDLQGILWALDHLEDLGVTAIYLNPVFEAESLHKYETSDYRHIDDNFGVRGDLEGLKETPDPDTWVFTPSDRLFLDLLAECHRRGMRVIVDGVFNHCGRAHWAFQDVLARGSDSEFAGWYKVTSWEPFAYEGWAGERDLPEWNQDETGLVEPVKRHIFDITRRWMDPDGDGDPSDGIDGWRLDVPNEIPKPFWEEWCALVREINPDAYLVGELWGRSPDWVVPALFDAHMNYEWLRGVYRFFVNDDPEGGEPVYNPSQFNAHLFELLAAYPPSVGPVMQNLLDSHDTDRIASALLNPNRPLDQRNRVQDGDGVGYDQSRPGPAQWRRLRLIQLFQFTWVGAPMVWYGDEVGMWGADDPECRKPMLWVDLAPYDNPLVNQPDMGLRRHVRVLAQLRRELPALRRGLVRPALTDDEVNVYAFERCLRSQPSRDDVLVALNRSDRPATVSVPVRWPEGTQVRDIYRERVLEADGLKGVDATVWVVENGAIRLTLASDGGAVLVAAD